LAGSGIAGAATFSNYKLIHASYQERSFSLRILYNSLNKALISLDIIKAEIQEYPWRSNFQEKGETIMMGGGMMYGFGWIGLLLNVAIIVGIVILVVWAVKRFTSGSSSTTIQTPREILQTRYARGEITRDQYQQMLSDLG
jgi:putative membrane protein